MTGGPAFAASPLDPPPSGTNRIELQDVPACTDVPQVTEPAIGLGWRGIRTGTRIQGAGTYSFAPVIPCSQTSNYRVNFAVQLTAGTLSGTGNLTANSSVTVTCSSTQFGVTTSDTFSGGSPSLPGSGLSVGTIRWSGFFSFSSFDCPWLERIQVLVTDPAGTNVLVSAIWRPTFWDSADGGWSSDEASLDPYAELPISCEIEATGDDIFTWLSSWLGGIGPWVGCLFTPQGWDRSGLLLDTWNGSSVVAFGSTLSSALPGSLSCGELATIPFYGQAVVLDTCDVNFAPGWVKSGVTFAIILALGWAIVARVLWSLGSSA